MFGEVAGHVNTDLVSVHARYLMWSDAYVSTDRIADLKPYQRLNHFPGMGEISRKDSLARNLVK